MTTRSSTADQKGTERICSVPLSIYSAPGGLRQDPGHAGKSLAEARTGVNWGLPSVYRNDVRPCGSGCRGGHARGELVLAGVVVAIVERRASQDLTGSRAGGLHSRTIEVFDQRGIADRFLSQGTVGQVAGFSLINLDISDFPTRHNYGLALWQNHIERILADWVGELQVRLYRGREVTGLMQDDAGVDVELSAGPSLCAKYLVGCD